MTLFLPLSPTIACPFAAYLHIRFSLRTSPRPTQLSNVQSIDFHDSKESRYTAAIFSGWKRTAYINIHFFILRLASSDAPAHSLSRKGLYNTSSSFLYYDYLISTAFRFSHYPLLKTAMTLIMLSFAMGRFPVIIYSLPNKSLNTTRNRYSSFFLRIRLITPLGHKLARRSRGHTQKPFLRHQRTRQNHGLKKKTKLYVRENQRRPQMESLRLATLGKRKKRLFTNFSYFFFISFLPILIKKSRFASSLRISHAPVHQVIWDNPHHGRVYRYARLCWRYRMVQERRHPKNLMLG